MSHLAAFSQEICQWAYLRFLSFSAEKCHRCCYWYRKLYFPSLFLISHWKCVFVIIVAVAVVAVDVAAAAVMVVVVVAVAIIIVPAILYFFYASCYFIRLFTVIFLLHFFIIIFASGFAISICIEIDYLCPYGIIQFNIKLCRNVILAAAAVCTPAIQWKWNEMKARTQRMWKRKNET